MSVQLLSHSPSPRFRGSPNYLFNVILRLVSLTIFVLFCFNHTVFTLYYDNALPLRMARLGGGNPLPLLLFPYIAHACKADHLWLCTTSARVRRDGDIIAPQTLVVHKNNHYYNQQTPNHTHYASFPIQAPFCGTVSVVVAILPSSLYASGVFFLT